MLPSCHTPPYVSMDGFEPEFSGWSSWEVEGPPRWEGEVLSIKSGKPIPLAGEELIHTSLQYIPYREARHGLSSNDKQHTHRNYYATETYIMSAPNPIVTEHLPGVDYKRLDYNEVVASLGAGAQPLKAASEGDAAGGISTPAGGVGAGVEELVSRRVQAKNMQEIIKSSAIPHLDAVLERAVVTNETAYPWRTAGKVFVGANNNFNAPIWMGSGVLVGKNLLLTAGHVCPWDKPGWWMRFIPAYKNGAEPYGSSYVQTFYGYRRDNDVHGRDYAICRLFTPLGNTVGWMGTQSFGSDDGYLSGSWISLGYPVEGGTNPNGSLMMVEQPVRIVDVDDEGDDGKELESDVYSMGGWSGGPLWASIGGDPLAVGVLSGQETDFLQPRHTVSAGGIAMVRLVQYGLATWPA